MADLTESRKCPYLPPEIWQRILSQHTNPSELWTVGRQVCSLWRFEIPKVFAKKYLEDPEMVVVRFDNDSSHGVDMSFNRYEGKTDDRCVF
jgi:hypothetical protein